MNRDIAIGMYLAVFGSVLILVAMCLTNGFSHIAETISFCCARSRSCSRSGDKTIRASEEQRETEGDTELQTLRPRPRPRPRTEHRPSGIQGPLVREEHISAYFYGWYLPYNDRRLTQTEREREPETEHEDLPRYEHPPAYARADPSTQVYGEERNGHRESLDVTERGRAPGPRNESGNMAVAGHCLEPENDRRSLDVTEGRGPRDTPSSCIHSPLDYQLSLTMDLNFIKRYRWSSAIPYSAGEIITYKVSVNSNGQDLDHCWEEHPEFPALPIFTSLAVINIMEKVTVDMPRLLPLYKPEKHPHFGAEH
ncbi:hypothetical protein BDW71DRAFT_207299 [Aspergillus fruticulosus]